MQAPLFKAAGVALALERCNSNDEAITDTDDIAMAFSDTQGVNGSLPQREDAKGICIRESKGSSAGFLGRLHWTGAAQPPRPTELTSQRTVSTVSIAISFLRRRRSQGPLGREQARRSHCLSQSPRKEVHSCGEIGQRPNLCTGKHRPFLQ